MVFYAAFNSISVVSRRHLTLFMSFWGFISTRLGPRSVLPKDTPAKNQEDPVLLEPRIPGKRVKHFTTESCRTTRFCLTLFQTSSFLQYRSFKNTVGKGQIARHDQFLIFPRCFLSFWITFRHFRQIKTSNSEESKICRLGKG